MCNVEAEKDNDQEEVEMKKHIEIVKEDKVAIDAIPLAIKPPMIVEYKIVKEGKFGYFQLITSKVLRSGSLQTLVARKVVKASSLIPLSYGSFDVLVGIDRLSKRKFGIVCHENEVRIPLEGDEVLRVHGERTQGVLKTLMNTKVVEFRVDLVPGGTPVVKSPYRLAPFGNVRIVETTSRVARQGFHMTYSEELGSTYDTIRDMIILRIGFKDKILATPSETSKVENMTAEMLRDLANKWIR
ncbi:hypothetical protein Tco_0691785 [Tanacetum coccineum]